MRHKSMVFDGENLLLPGGSPVVFHLRRQSKGGVSCLYSAMDYEEQWVPAGAGRRWRLSSSWWLTGTEFGFEISKGGDGLSVHGFTDDLVTR